MHLQQSSEPESRRQQPSLRAANYDVKDLLTAVFGNECENESEVKTFEVPGRYLLVESAQLDKEDEQAQGYISRP